MKDLFESTVHLEEQFIREGVSEGLEYDWPIDFLILTSADFITSATGKF